VPLALFGLKSILSIMKFETPAPTVIFFETTVVVLLQKLTVAVSVPTPFPAFVSVVEVPEVELNVTRFGGLILQLILFIGKVLQVLIE
jgi:hypothetical protein